LELAKTLEKRKQRGKEPQRRVEDNSCKTEQVAIGSEAVRDGGGSGTAHKVGSKNQRGPDSLDSTVRGGMGTGRDKPE